jgi:adenine-specific DNA-methyltransferase
MGNVMAQREKLVKKLYELFEMDQPDLDFGFYRIMHAKADQVKQFIDGELIETVERVFAANQDVDNAQQINEARDILRESLGSNCVHENGDLIEPFASMNIPAIKQYKETIAAIRSSKENLSIQARIYNHLLKFFERYYDNGDFISRRYFTRETDTRTASFAIPYNGEEVKLHWANADQYYTKTTTDFSKYSFDLVKYLEHKVQIPLFNNIVAEDSNPNSLKIHFRIVEASEGEHGNVQEKHLDRRFFVLKTDKPVELNESDELVVNFSFVPLPNGKYTIPDERLVELKNRHCTNKGGSVKSPAKIDIPDLDISDKIIDAVKEVLGEEHLYTKMVSLVNNDTKNGWSTDNIPQRPLINRYVNQYTNKNTKDFFIHKDLGSFLRRELEYYIKNEVQTLNNEFPSTIEMFEAFNWDNRLSIQSRKMEAMIRIIGSKIIQFLAQLENFQKKLWLKKKFVVETNYCVTLDKVPESLYGDIVVNEDQIQEWKDLKVVREDDDINIAYLHNNSCLMIDTKHFIPPFTEKLLGLMRNVDECIKSLLVKSENFQSLNFLKNRFQKQVKCIYIDPPYNTDASEIIYKNNYKHSSWMSLMHNRMELSYQFHSEDSFIFVAIDDYELFKLNEMLEEMYSKSNFIGNVSVIHKPEGRQFSKFLGKSNEFMLIYSFNWNQAKFYPVLLDEKKEVEYANKDEQGVYKRKNFIRLSDGDDSRRENKPKCWYPIYVSKDCKTIKLSIKPAEKPNFYAVFPTTTHDRTWKVTKKSCDKKYLSQGSLEAVLEGEKVVIYEKMRPEEIIKSHWIGEEYHGYHHGTKILTNIIGQKLFDYPKSIKVVYNSLKLVTQDSHIVLDYFGGSGTTAHATLNLNRKDGGKRSYILCEMGEHFNTVIIPRIKKVVYSKDWKKGKPTNPESGISHCFKYIRLESYEDTLNNLKNTPSKYEKVKENTPAFCQNYMLNYMLDLETKDNRSMCNIQDFADPWNYTLSIKKSHSNAKETKAVDLVETFNYLIGLRIQKNNARQSYSAVFESVVADAVTNVDGVNTREFVTSLEISEDGEYHFKSLTGWIPKNHFSPNDGEKLQVIIIWRNLTKDNDKNPNERKDALVLNAWIEKQSMDLDAYDRIYINGSNTIQNDKVRLLEDTFFNNMWSQEV